MSDDDQLRREMQVLAKWTRGQTVATFRLDGALERCLAWVREGSEYGNTRPDHEHVCAACGAITRERMADRTEENR